MTAIDVAAGRDFARVAHVLVNARLTWWRDASRSLGGSIGHVEKRYDDDANTVPLSSNTLVNIYGAWSLTGTLQLYARIENLFDIHHEPVFGSG